MTTIDQKFDQLVAKIDEMRLSNTAEHQVVCAKLEKIDTALFATDDENEYGITGLMVTARKMSSHIDTVCTLGRFTKKAAQWLAAVASAVSAIWFLGFQLGWW
jgi:hypothetical protein